MLKHQERNVLGKLSISFAGALILGSTLVAPMTEAAEVPVPGAQDGEITHYIINDNVPYFTNDELLEVDPGYTLSDLDELGRVQVANATLSQDIMPDEKRGSISHVTPTGWNQNTRGDEVGQVVPGGWLYNRSHMIGHQLSGLNDEKENLITGTKFFNNYAMLPIENFVANYIEEEDESVRFRVTPHFEGDNLLASGMFMEGLTLHDIGDEDPDIMFNIYVPNIQPGVTLNYADGSHSVGETNEVIIPTHPHAKNFDAVTPPEEDNDETAPPVEEDDNETVPPVEEGDPEVPIEEEENPDTPVENDPDTPVEDEENPDAPVEEDNGETIPPVEEEDPDAPVENDPAAPEKNEGDETADNETIEEEPDAPVENDGNETTDDESIEEDVATDNESVEEDAATDDESIEEDVATDDVTTDDEATLPAEEDNVETTLPAEEDVTSDDQHVVSDTESTDDTASEIDTDLSTIHDGSSIQKPVVDEDVDELPETGSGAPEIGLIASAMALIIGAGIALFKRRESNNN